MGSHDSPSPTLDDDRVFLVQMVGRHTVGAADRRTALVNRRLLVSIVSGKVSWVSDGELLYSNTDPSVVELIRFLLDRIAGLDAVLDERIQNVFHGSQVGV